jgi:hypothetical protein
VDPTNLQALGEALRALTQQRVRGEVSDDEYETQVRALEAAAHTAGLKLGIGTGSFRRANLNRDDSPE